MARTVQLSNKAYRSLYVLKREGDSFSDIVDRLIRERKDPTRLLALSSPDEDPR